MGRIRVLVIAAVACVALASLGVSGAAVSCAGSRVVPGIGRTCSGPNGLLEVLGPDGAFLGYTHGLDPQVSQGTQAPRAVSASPSDPLCVPGTAGTNYIEVIYARATDDTDGYAANVAGIRDMVRTMNGIIAEAAVNTGDRARLRVLCSGTTIDVRNEVLPTRKASADFSTVISDLRAKGYIDPLVHYAVFYDDPAACSCGGQGLFYDDEQTSANNLNNGSATVPLFAVDYGHLDAKILTHEVGHTLGAVQMHSPHNTGAHHCYDGYDIMCYNDGGPRGSLYSTRYCPSDVFDCGHDDYFNAHPAPGSYLATHWNIASRVNRFLDFPEPLLQFMTCPSLAGVRHPVTCSLIGQGASNLAFNVSWGDGTISRFPSTGFAKAGSAVGAVHTYAATGTFSVSASPVDGAGTSGEPVNDSIKAIVDDTPPAMTVLDPVDATAYSTCATQGSAPGASITFVKTGCVRVNASDAGTGVESVSIFFNTSHAGTIYKAPYTFQPPISTPAMLVTLRVEAKDYAGNVTTRTFTVNFI